MSIESDIPEPKHLARWRKEMKSWPNADLVNKQYYDAIDNAMASKEAPTIRDAIGQMALQGNAAYFEKFSHLNPNAIEPTFRNSQATEHEISHLCGRFPQTPEGEQLSLPFQFGFEFGLQLVEPRGMKEDDFPDLLDDVGERYREISRKYLKPGIPSEDIAGTRNRAIYVAAGMYLREKFDRLHQQDLNSRTWEENVHGEQRGMPIPSYDEQRHFAETYADTDHDPGPQSGSRSHYQTFKEHHFGGYVSFGSWLANDKMPYAMIQISPKEWDAIIAVATGLKTPEETPYPQRLTAIQQALEKAKLFPTAEQRATEASRLDPEQFRVGRVSEAGEAANKGRG